MIVEIMHVSKIALSRAGLLYLCYRFRFHFGKKYMFVMLLGSYLNLNEAQKLHELLLSIVSGNRSRFNSSRPGYLV